MCYEDDRRLTGASPAQFWAGANPKWAEQVSGEEFVNTVLPYHVTSFFDQTGQAYSTDVFNEIIGYGDANSDAASCVDSKKAWPSTGPFHHDLSWAVTLTKLVKATGKGGILMINDVQHTPSIVWTQR